MAEPAAPRAVGRPRGACAAAQQHAVGERWDEVLCGKLKTYTLRVCSCDAATVFKALVGQGGSHRCHLCTYQQRKLRQATRAGSADRVQPAPLLLPPEAPPAASGGDNTALGRAVPEPPRAGSPRPSPAPQVEEQVEEQDWGDASYWPAPASDDDAPEPPEQVAGGQEPPEAADLSPACPAPAPPRRTRQQARLETQAQPAHLSRAEVLEQRPPSAVPPPRSRRGGVAAPPTPPAPPRQAKRARAERMAAVVHTRALFAADPEPAYAGQRVELLSADGILDAGVIVAVHAGELLGAVDVRFDEDQAEHGDAVQPRRLDTHRQVLYAESDASARLYTLTLGQRVAIFWDHHLDFLAAVVTEVAPDGRSGMVLFDCDVKPVPADVCDMYIRDEAAADLAALRHKQAALEAELAATVAALAGGAAAAAAVRRKPYGDINVIGENVSSMPTMWVPYFQRHLRGLQRQLHDAADEGAAARRVRSIWTTAVDFLADVHCLPPELLRHVLYPDLLAGLHLPGTPSGQPRDLLAGITTAAASRPFVKRVNDTAAAWVAGGRGRRLSDDAAFTDDKQLKDMRQLGVVFDQRRQVWRSLTLRERCMAMGFPPDYLDSVSSQSEAEAMLGDSFSVGTILRVLHAMRDDLSCFSAVNLVSLFDGIGGGIQAAMILHRAGVIKLRTIFIVEIVAARRAIVREWLHAQQLDGVTLVEMGDITDLSDEAFIGLLQRAGGAHIVVAGSPCNNLSGRNRTQGITGRSGLAGPASILFFELPRLLAAAARVALAFRRAWRAPAVGRV